jgi:hypothetical protein
VRRESGIPAGSGPNDARILAAVEAYVEKFDFWYIRVMKGAVPQYRSVIIQRINPLIARVRYEGLDCESFAVRLVADYNARNIVTAGGWAIDVLPPSLNYAYYKLTAGGIDLERREPEQNAHRTYILKSGPVTRNFDIVRSLKQHSREAERLLRQNNSKVNVTMNYIVAAGKNSSTFKDGVHRPSSAEFWAEVTDLGEQQAVDLVVAIANEAGRLVQSDASEYILALRTLLGTYLADPTDPTRVDWTYLKRRLFSQRPSWAAEDRQRHQAALAALKTTGFGAVSKVAAAAAREEAALDSGVDEEDILANDPAEGASDEE